MEVLLLFPSDTPLTLVKALPEAVTVTSSFYYTFGCTLQCFGGGGDINIILQYHTG